MFVIWPPEDEIPFDKDHLCNQLEAGGGVVLDRYDPERVSSTDEIILTEYILSK